MENISCECASVIINKTLLRFAREARSSLILKSKITLYGKEKEGKGKEEGQEGKETPLVFRKDLRKEVFSFCMEEKHGR